MKGITPVIGIIIILLIVIALLGFAYTYLTYYYTTRTSKTIALRDAFRDIVILTNTGTSPIDTDELDIRVNGKKAYTKERKTIQPGKSETLTLIYPEPPNRVTITSPSNTIFYNINFPFVRADTDGDGLNEGYLNAHG